MKKRQTTTRLFLLTCVSVLLLAGLFSRLAHFQVAQGETLLKKANNEITTLKTVQAARGNITDRYGRVLAGNKTSFRLTFDRTGMKPEQINDTILKLISLSGEEGFAWENRCPLIRDGSNVVFDESGDTEALKEFLDLEASADAEDCLQSLLKKYELENQGKKVFEIACARYSMQKLTPSVGNRYPFAENLSLEAVARVEEESTELDGVEIEEVPVRVYLNGDIASHLIGTIGPIYAEEYEELRKKGYAMNDTVGKSGIESAMEEVLRGQNGKVRVIQNKNGEIIDTVTERETRAGSDVQLTIDSLLQDELQQLLTDFVSTAHSEDYQSKGGAIVVLDVKTGEVLAAVNSANYTVEEYKENYQDLLQQDTNPLFNRALQGVYRPGSSLKPVVAIAAMEEGKLGVNESLLCISPFEYRGHEYTCLQDHHNGYIPLTEALHWSCNTFFYRLGLRLGIEELNKYAAYMGLGQKTGLEIGEAAGRFASPETTERLGGTWYPGDLLQAAIGQNETAVSPLQMACEAMTIANQGTRYETHLVRSVTDINGTVTFTEPKVAAEFEMSQSTYNAVSKGMSLAAGKYGLDSSVAQKTGTAQTTSVDRVNNDFIAYLPIDDPEIAVSCIVEDCSGGTAALLEQIIEIYQKCKQEGDILQNSQ